MKMKRDKARIETDKQLVQMEKQIEKIYRKSAKGIVKKWNDYMAQSAKEIEPLQIAYDEAKKLGDDDLIKKTGKKLGIAKRDQTLKNDYYKDMLANVTENLAKVNQTALNYINGEMPKVYVENYNQAEDIADTVGVKFNIVNEDVVRRRVFDGDIQLPYKDLNKIKDVRWNTKQLNSSVLQGILQGESMNDIAKRILPIVNNNQASSMRNARTMVTGAENQGRLDSYKRLEEDGLVLKKVWLATSDSRVRASHASLDGESVDIDKEFSNKLMFPGDPNGSAGEVYNCRCTMITDVVGFKKANGKVKYIDDRKRKYNKLKEVYNNIKKLSSSETLNKFIDEG